MPVSLVLTQPLTYAGVHHPIGSQLDVDAFTAEWLLRYGIAHALPHSEQAAASKTTTPAKPKE